MDHCVFIVDISNLLIEGQVFSAKQKDIVKKDPADPDICDLSWRFDVGKLTTVAAEGRKIAKVILVGPRPHENDFIWDDAQRGGFDLLVYELDPKMAATEIAKQLNAAASPCILKLFSPGKDLLPLVALAESKNWETELWTFTGSSSSGGERAKAVTRIKLLDDLYLKFGRHEFRWPVPISQEFEKDIWG